MVCQLLDVELNSVSTPLLHARRVADPIYCSWHSKQSMEGSSCFCGDRIWSFDLASVKAPLIRRNIDASELGQCAKRLSVIELGLGWSIRFVAHQLAAAFRTLRQT